LRRWRGKLGQVVSGRLRLRAAIYELYARAREGEPTRDVFLRIKQIVKKEGLTMTEQINGNVPTLEAEALPKKRGGRRKANNEGVVTLEAEAVTKKRGNSRRKAAAVNGATPMQAVTLSPAQVCNLWRAVTGGELVIEETFEGVVCRVSFESFEKALPVLLDQLRGGPNA
jgi:hypothetical protein